MSMPGLGEPDASVSNSPEGNDAGLLELCAAFLAASTTVSAMPDEDDLALALQARDSLAGRIRAIPPLSPDGVRAKAQVGLALLGEGSPPGLAGDGVGFALTLLRELAAGVPCAGLEVTGRDAELLAACATLDALEHEATTFHKGASRIVDDDERSAALAVIVARQEPWLERMCALRVASPIAWQARAGSLALWKRDMLAG